MSTLQELDRTILLCRDHVVNELPDEKICENFRSLRVLCVSDARNLSSHSGQTALITLVSLISRMGMQVGLSFPNAAMLMPQPPLSGPSVYEALIASSETLLTGSTVCHGLNFDPDLIFVLGDTKIKSEHAPGWRLDGGDWYGALALDGAESAHVWTAEWPIGSMVSAALAAAEAFKFAMRRLPLSGVTDRLFFELSPSCNWKFDPICIPEAGLRFGEVDIISAGAISQAALYALMRLPNVQMSGRIFDDDLTGPSNLNRNMLSLVADVGSKKVNVVTRNCSPNLRIQGIPDRFVGEVSKIGRLASRILVGVDDIPSRWQVQRCAPYWLAVSGTSHFSVSSSRHRLDEPCCGCLHPTDAPTGANAIPTVSFVSFWAGLVMAVRLIREALGIPDSPDRQHLWLTPLRMDQVHAAMWLPVAPRRDCPVKCFAARALASS
jgi:hypothetical protein